MSDDFLILKSIKPIAYIHCEQNNKLMFPYYCEWTLIITTTILNTNVIFKEKLTTCPKFN